MCVHYRFDLMVCADSEKFLKNGMKFRAFLRNGSEF